LTRIVFNYPDQYTYSLYNGGSSFFCADGSSKGNGSYFAPSSRNQVVYYDDAEKEFVIYTVTNADQDIPNVS
jgi:hypothetical protein